MSYAKGDQAKFNAEVKEYADLLAGAKLPGLNLDKVRFEAFFKRG